MKYKFTKAEQETVTLTDNERSVIVQHSVAAIQSRRCKLKADLSTKD